MAETDTPKNIYPFPLNMFSKTPKTVEQVDF